MAGVNSIAIMDAASWRAMLEAVQTVHAEGLAPEVSAVHEEIVARRALVRLQQGRVPPEARAGAGAGGVSRLYLPGASRGPDGTMRLVPEARTSGGGFADRLARVWHGLTRDYQALAVMALNGDDLAMEQWLAMAEKNGEAREHLIESARGQPAVVLALSGRAETSEASRNILWQVAENGDGQALRACLELIDRVPAFRALIRSYAVRHPNFIGRLGGQVDIPAAREILFELAATNSSAYDFLIILAQSDEEAFARVVGLAVGNHSCVQVLAERARDSGGRALEALTHVAERDAYGLEALVDSGKLGFVVAGLDVSALLVQVRGDQRGESARVVLRLITAVERLVRSGRGDLVGNLAALERSYRLAHLPEDSILVCGPADLAALSVPVVNFQPANYMLVKFGNGQIELRLTHAAAYAALLLRWHGEQAVAAGRVFYHAESDTLLFDDETPDFSVTGHITESNHFGIPAVTAFVRSKLPETWPRPGPLAGLVGRPAAELDFLAREREIYNVAHKAMRTLLSAHDVLSEPRRCVWVRRANGAVEARLIPILTASEAVVLSGETIVAIGLLRRDLITGETTPRRVYLELESGDATQVKVLLRNLAENPEVVFGSFYDVAAEIAKKTSGAGIIVTSGNQIQMGERYKYAMVINYAGKPELRIVAFKTGEALKKYEHPDYEHPDLVSSWDLTLIGAGWLTRRPTDVIGVDGKSGNFPTHEDRYVGRKMPAASRSGLRAVREIIAELFGEKVADKMYEDD